MSLNLKETYGLLINNEWVPASDGTLFEAHNPANGELLAKCAEATKEDVDRAVDAATEAFKTWKHTSKIERANYLLAIADAIDAHLEHFAQVETHDNGKPIRETRGLDIPFASDHFRYFAGVLRAEEGSATMLDDNTMALIVHDPIGVVGQVVPWNFPFLMAAWKLAPALASGCTVVIKPSSHTSLSLLGLGDVLKNILPPGVVNIVTGKGSQSGQFILDHPGFSKLAFTGSTEVGLDVYKAASQRLIPATLELGGKSANIFFEDANWEQALDGAMLGILFNQGQVCCAGSRIFVQDTIYDKFVAELSTLFNNVKVGLPWNDDTQLGSASYEGQVRKVLEYVEIAKQEGATIAAGGVRVTEDGLDKGCFVRPTLITNVTNDMRVAREEIFGPVAVIIKFHSEEEVIEMANDSQYGLGGGVFTQNINRAIRVARAVETGRMWVNTYNSIPAGAPFGGVKQSGIGRETHKVMLEHYTQMKSIIINLNDQPSGLYDLDR
ncbi:aldehyde dehydrogenase family protein [Veillonella sp.]|uniref:aldehyde dehydrogenase family protein n=1 Tax=Veillonella sp. TaxID=1926307 RepID=UPI001B52E9C0|nr:aldehyde dehydrogenase family protein [Veillonella sp.]MBP8616919.1 aldehyde dehydrogenase family protein [Veillonella sp.]MBP9517074.1 aldehyde dehydrogenase family protein [Veillonella sp.]MBP9550799.1 aldehyde dehydrogenase family protein [Veillonella sp.]